MKISKVIEELKRIQEEHGDLPCVTQDGYDPSEWSFVTSVMRQITCTGGRDVDAKEVVEIAS